MGKINIPHSDNIQATKTGESGYSFNSLGQPIYINEYGEVNVIGLSTDNIENIIANLGVGLESELPEDASQGDIYVTSDTFEIFTKLDAITWNTIDLIEKQFITDTNEINIYQYNGIEVILLTSYEAILNDNFVQGAASSIDNAIARFDGTTGKLIQSSVVGIDDVGGIKPVSAMFGIEYDNGNSSISNTITISNGQNQKITLTGDCDITFVPLSGTSRFQVKFIQDTTGGRNVTFTNTVINPSEFNFSEGAADQECIATFYYDGSKYIMLSTPYYTIP